jgi:histidinol dehydrogenase
MSQAEHDKNSAAICITNSKNIADDIKNVFIERLKEKFKSQDKKVKKEAKKIYTAFCRNGAIILCKNIEEAIKFSNIYSPEHLEILTKKPKSLLRYINNAGSIFLGEWTPVSAGDYFSGTNHILPTSGFANCNNGININTFIKKPTWQMITKEVLNYMRYPIGIMSTVENLYNEHGLSVEERFIDGKSK